MLATSLASRAAVIWLLFKGWAWSWVRAMRLKDSVGPTGGVYKRGLLGVIRPVKHARKKCLKPCLAAHLLFLIRLAGGSGSGASAEFGPPSVKIRVATSHKT